MLPTQNQPSFSHEPCSSHQVEFSSKKTAIGKKTQMWQPVSVKKNRMKIKGQSVRLPKDIRIPLERVVIGIEPLSMSMQSMSMQSMPVQTIASPRIHQSSLFEDTIDCQAITASSKRAPISDAEIKTQVQVANAQFKKVIDKNYYDFVVENDNQMRDISRQYFGWQRLRAAIALWVPSLAAGVVGVLALGGVVSAGAFFPPIGIALGGMAILYAAYRVGSVDWLVRKVHHEKKWLIPLLNDYKRIQERDNAKLETFFNQLAVTFLKNQTEKKREIHDSLEITEVTSGLIDSSEMKKNQEDLVKLRIALWILFNAENTHPKSLEITHEYHRKTLGIETANYLKEQIHHLDRNTLRDSRCAPVLSPELCDFLHQKGEVALPETISFARLGFDPVSLDGVIRLADRYTASQVSLPADESRDVPLMLSGLSRRIFERQRLYQWAQKWVQTILVDAGPQTSEVNAAHSIDRHLMERDCDSLQSLLKLLNDWLWAQQQQKGLSRAEKKAWAQSTCLMPYRIETQLCAFFTKQSFDYFQQNASMGHLLKQLQVQTQTMISQKRHPFFQYPARKPQLSVESAERMAGIVQELLNIYPTMPYFQVRRV